MMRIYIVVVTEDKYGYGAVALCEDGNVLAGHVSSEDSFIAHDMGVTSNWHHDQYDMHCGKGNWELVLALDGSMVPHEVYAKHKEIRLNKKGRYGKV